MSWFVVQDRIALNAPSWILMHPISISQDVKPMLIIENKAQELKKSEA